MTFKELTLDDKEFIKESYKNSKLSKDDLQEALSERYDVSKRSIREWAKNMGVGVMAKNVVDPAKILVYDIETCRVSAKVFWTGKTYINHTQLRAEPRIISVSWRWLGEEQVHSLSWSLPDQSDEKLMTKFLEVYNEADMVVGFNNKSFDDRWINARAMKYNLFVNVHVKSFDIIKHCKKLFRLPSYSMAYIAKFMGITLKQSHEGIKMWDMIEDGTPHEQAEYIHKMVTYNIGDIVTTEEMFLKLRKYMGHVIHFGVFKGNERYTCPTCGGDNIELFKVTYTAAGTMQYIMHCKDDDTQFKLSHSNYMKFLQKKVEEFNNTI